MATQGDAAVDFLAALGITDSASGKAAASAAREGLLVGA